MSHQTPSLQWLHAYPHPVSLIGYFWLSHYSPILTRSLPNSHLCGVSSTPGKTDNMNRCACVKAKGVKCMSVRSTLSTRWCWWCWLQHGARLPASPCMREWTRRQTCHVCLRIREQIFNRHFRSGPNFLHYYYSVRRQSFSLLFSFRSKNLNHFLYRYRELRPFFIVLVIIIVNENITDSLTF